LDPAYVALALDERIAQREGLRQAHGRIVDGGVAVRVIVAQDEADHLGAFHRGMTGEKARRAHPGQDAPLHGFQAVACIGQRAVGDDREAVSGKRLRDDHGKVFLADNPGFLRRLLLC
jgi:hypothetical protein